MQSYLLQYIGNGDNVGPLIRPDLGATYPVLLDKGLVVANEMPCL